MTTGQKGQEYFDDECACFVGSWQIGLFWSLTTSVCMCGRSLQLHFALQFLSNCRGITFLYKNNENVHKNIFQLLT